MSEPKKPEAEESMAQLLAEQAEEVFSSAAERARGLIRYAKELRELASKMGDAAVPDYMEDNKRDCVRLWRESADLLEAIESLIDQGPMPAKALADELYQMLSNGWTVYDTARQHFDATHIQRFFQERSNNIAQGLANRVLREVV